MTKSAQRGIAHLLRRGPSPPTAPPSVTLAGGLAITSLAELRTFLSFFLNSSTSAIEEYRLQRKCGVKFVHLLDFQELRALISPFLRNPLEHSPMIARYFTSQKFFEDLEENIFLPLGTLAELSSFLQAIRRSVHLLTTVAHTGDIDRALDSFLSYFKHEDFLDRNKALTWLGTQGDHSDRLKLYGLQVRAASILQNYEKGLEKLLKVLTHKRNYNLSEIIGKSDFQLDAAKYSEFFQALEGVPDTRRQRLGNQVDAYNLSLTITLNAYLDSLRVNGDLSAPICVKLVTDTKSLLKLNRNSSIDIDLRVRNFAELDVSVNLLEQYEELVLKRLFFSYADQRGIDTVREFVETTKRAIDAITGLEDEAKSEKVELQDFFQGLLEPRDLRHRSRLLSTYQYIEDLSRFFLGESDAWGGLLDRQVRQQLFLVPTQLSEASIASFSACSIASISNLISSIHQVILAADSVEIDLSPLQRGSTAKRWVNPLLSLERLGYREVLVKEEHYSFWEVQEISSGASVLRLEKHPGLWSANWPSVVPLVSQVDILLKSIGEDHRPGNDEVNLLVIDYRGERIEETIELSALGSLVRRVENVSLFRVDFPTWAFVAELFTPDPRYELRAGLILREFNLQLIKTLFFGGLSASMSNIFLQRVLDSSLNDVVSGKINLERSIR